MTPEEFIEAIKHVVHDSAIRHVISSLKQPPGRQPPQHSQALSQWYNGLSESEQQVVTDIVTSAVHATVFDFLCVLDGVIAIESSPKKSQLELNAVKDNRQTRLNDQRKDLHDIYQALVWEEVFGETRPYPGK